MSKEKKNNLKNTKSERKGEEQKARTNFKGIAL